MSATRPHRPASRHHQHRTSTAAAAVASAPLHLTATARALAPSPTLEINEAIAARRANGQEVIHLGFGEASFPLHPSLRAALDAAAASTGYAPVLGIPALRAAIAGYLARERGLDTTPESIATAPGSKPLLYALLQVLEGDVLIPRPSWVSYAPQARLAGRRVFAVATDPVDHHRLTPAALNAALIRARHEGANPRVLVVNTPSNPTGGMFAAEDVEALAGWARTAGITIISDEIYAELAHGWRQHLSPARFYPEGTVVTGGLSKAFSAGGWRLGYAAVPTTAAGKKLLAAVRSLASEIWSSSSGPIQEAAVVAYSPSDDLAAYVRRSARLHGHVVGRLHHALASRGVLCSRPAGAFYLYPDFAPWRTTLAQRGIRTGLELARHLLDEWGIATLPAQAFGEEPDALRLRVATSMLYAENADAPGAVQEEALWTLLTRADDLPAEDPASGAALPLPALDRAQARFAEFVDALGEPEASASQA